MVIQPGETEIVIVGARDLAVKARQQSVDGVALRRSGGRAAPHESLGGGVDHRRRHIAIDHRKAAIGEIEVDKVKQLVLDDRAAQAGAAFHALLGWNEGREGVAGIESSAAEKVETVAMQLVGAALGDGVDHAAHGTPILGGIILGDNLELLYGILRDLRLNACAPGVFVVKLFGVVVAIEQERVVAGHAAEAQQAEGCVVAHAGSQQYERIHAPPVDRQILELRFADDGGYVRFGVVHHAGRRRHLHLGRVFGATQKLPIESTDFLANPRINAITAAIPTAADTKF